MHETSDNIAALVSAGANVNARQKYGVTPLHIAASYGTPSHIAALLSAGAEVDARTQAGKTPLHIAAAIGTPDNIAALLEAGASGSAKDKSGKTPFDLAQSNDSSRIVFNLGGDRLKGTAVYRELNDAQYK
jgi:ankyrin repeat protein